MLAAESPKVIATHPHKKAKVFGPYLSASNVGRQRMSQTAVMLMTKYVVPYVAPSAGSKLLSNFQCLIIVLVTIYDA